MLEYIERDSTPAFDRDLWCTGLRWEIHCELYHTLICEQTNTAASTKLLQAYTARWKDEPLQCSFATESYGLRQFDSPVHIWQLS